MELGAKPDVINEVCKDECIALNNLYSLRMKKQSLTMYPIKSTSQFFKVKYNDFSLSLF